MKKSSKSIFPVKSRRYRWGAKKTEEKQGEFLGGNIRESVDYEGSDMKNRVMRYARTRQIGHKGLCRTIKWRALG